jgi:hypothetical protein
MKTITLLLMIGGMSVAQAQVYRCPGKVEGQYTYQDRPCKGAKAGEHTIKIIPADEQKIAEAQAKLAKELNANTNQQIKEPPTEAISESNNTGRSSEKSKPPAKAANTNSGVASPNPANTPSAVIAPPAVPVKKDAIRPAPVLPNPVPAK